ncbi:MAG: hypothetical protein OEN56_09820 [Gemmatimonadota bacterium]|nr:hypothetical protein [Gemmatimonadota bacterium]
MKRTFDGRGRLRAAIAAAVGIVILSACEGKNLFTISATGGETGPTVEITTPSVGFTIAVGDSILIEANVNAPSGGNQATYKGVAEGSGSVLYTQETADLNGLVVVTLSNYLRAAPGQTAGSANIIVEVSDALGEIGADTVSVTIS